MLEQDDLLAPISADNPAGDDLSFSPEFDAIQEARRADDPSLDQGEWVTELKHADWPTAAALCAELLRSRTKDLRVAAWYTEASARLRGLPGLADGFRLLAGLCEQHWDAVHPQDRDAGHEERAGNLGWLVANAVQWLRATPVTDGPGGGFSLGDFEAAHANGGADQDGQSRIEVLEAARRDTAPGFHLALLSELEDCRAALEAFKAAVDGRMGADGPSFTALLEQLDALGHAVTRFARDAGALVDDGQVGEGLAAQPGLAAPSANGGAVSSRSEALARLREVADFFRRTEPHSPVAYLADKAARWGEMPLHAWLRRVIRDDATLAGLEELLDVDAGPERPAG